MYSLRTFQTALAGYAIRQKLAAAQGLGLGLPKWFLGLGLPKLKNEKHIYIYNCI